jgi:hypothetical protein
MHATQQLAAADTLLLPAALPSTRMLPHNCFPSSFSSPTVSLSPSISWLASSELSLALGSPPIGGSSPPPAPQTNPAQFPGPAHSNLNFFPQIPSFIIAGEEEASKFIHSDGKGALGGDLLCRRADGARRRQCGRADTACGQTTCSMRWVAVAEVEDRGILAILKNYCLQN